MIQQNNLKRALLSFECMALFRHTRLFVLYCAVVISYLTTQSDSTSVMHPPDLRPGKFAENTVLQRQLFGVLVKNEVTSSRRCCSSHLQQPLSYTYPRH
jgi:hypothetical protein